MYALIFLLAMALTGLTWSFPWYRTAFYKVFGVEVQQRAAQGHEQKSDARWYVREQIVMSGLDVLLKLLYPSLMILTDMDSQVMIYSVFNYSAVHSQKIQTHYLKEFVCMENTI